MISRDDIQKLSGLARLSLSEAEIDSLQKDISNILAYVDQVSAVSVSDEVKKVGLVHNVMRADEAGVSPLLEKRDALVAAFPESKDGYNVVRKVLHKDA